jgi:hypothetical protein
MGGVKEYQPMANATFDHLQFLDGLHESGVINMFDAWVYLQDAFPELGWEEARTIVVFWHETFTERHPEEEIA